MQPVNRMPTIAAEIPDQRVFVATLLNIREELLALHCRLQEAYGRGRRSLSRRRSARLLMLLDRLLVKFGCQVDAPPAATNERQSPPTFAEHAAIGWRLVSWRDDLLGIIRTLSGDLRITHPIVQRVHLITIRLDDLRWALDSKLSAESTLEEWVTLKLQSTYFPRN